MLAEKAERREGVGGVAAWDWSEPKWLDPLWCANSRDAGEALTLEVPPLEENVPGELEYEEPKLENICEVENGMDEEDKREEDMISTPRSIRRSVPPARRAFAGGGEASRERSSQ